MKINKILTFILVFVLMLTLVSSKTFAEDNVDYLDLETSNTYQDSKDLNQNYTFTQTGDVTYTDVTKVKLTWTINDIEATYTSHKTWDPTNLQWVEAKEDINVTHNGASFTLTNYSSKKVTGTVSFEAETSLKDTLTSVTFDDNNGKTIDTVVNVDYTIDETKKANVPSNTITATLAFNSDNFADLSATTSATKYGTYTVKIAEVTTKITFDELTYGKLGFAFSDNNIVLKGSTWEEVINNNENNTITISAGGNQANCKLIKSDGIVWLNIIGGGGTFKLFAADSSTEPSSENYVKLTDSLTDKLYIYAGIKN